MNQIAAIVLAAGRGSRMKSTVQNKVTLTLAKKPLISYTLDTLRQCRLDQIVVVVGFAKQSVIEVLGNTVTYALQRRRLGTGHAVKCALPMIKPEINTILTLSGDDSAFYRPDLIRQLLKTHEASGAALTFLTINKPDPQGLGRIIRDAAGQVAAIVEEKNATPEEKKIQEINTGLYCFKRAFLATALKKIQKNPVSGEYYLTDLVAIARNSGQRIETLTWADASVWHGVNTAAELAAAQAKVRLPLAD